jgi:hypothetical protein
LKRGESATTQEAVPQTPEKDVSESSPKREHRHHHSHRSGPQKPKRKTKRQFLREILLYALALAAFGGFLKWISEDHPSSPPTQ